MLWRATIIINGSALQSISIDGWGSWLSMGPLACSALVLSLGDWVSCCVASFFSKLLLWSLCGKMTMCLPLFRVLDIAVGGGLSQDWREIASRLDDRLGKRYARLACGDHLVGHRWGVPSGVTKMGGK